MTFELLVSKHKDYQISEHLIRSL